MTKPAKSLEELYYAVKLYKAAGEPRVNFTIEHQQALLYVMSDIVDDGLDFEEMVGELMGVLKDARPYSKRVH